MIDIYKLDYYLGCQNDDLDEQLKKDQGNERLIGAIKAFEMIRAQISLMQCVAPYEDEDATESN